jgi:peptide-methionine (S)-S-oxide reductase
MDQLQKAGIFSHPLATQLEPLTEFFPAEAYHHNYAQENPDQPYIACVAMPKVDALRQLYPAMLK